MTPVVYFWLAIVIFALIIEAMSSALIAVWFVPAGIVCMVLEALNVPLYLQIVIFAILSVVGIVVFASKMRANIEKNKVQTNADSVIGCRAIVEVALLPDSVGRVKVKGMSWSAISADNSAIDEGCAVKVLKIDGVKLIVEKES